MKDIHKQGEYLQPNKPFRSTYQYQNLMFLTAGYLEEQITGRKWEDLVRDQVFQPLAMSRSNFSVNEMQKDGDFAYPYAEMQGKVQRIPFRNIDAIGPAGSINSSVEEMASYIQFHIDLGKHGDRQVLSRRNALLMQTPQMVQPASQQTYPELGPSSYGLGLAISTYRGRKLVAHGGGIDGFVSQMAWLPNDKIGVMVLTNYSGSNPTTDLVARYVYDALLGLDHIVGCGSLLIRIVPNRIKAASRFR